MKYIFLIVNSNILEKLSNTHKVQRSKRRERKRGRERSGRDRRGEGKGIEEEQRGGREDRRASEEMDTS